jgi:hypothetical protein
VTVVATTARLASTRKISVLFPRKLKNVCGRPPELAKIQSSFLIPTRLLLRSYLHLRRRDRAFSPLFRMNCHCTALAAVELGVHCARTETIGMVKISAGAPGTDPTAGIREMMHE